MPSGPTDRGSLSFTARYFEAFVRPSRTFGEIIRQSQLNYGTRAVVIAALVYTLVYLFLIKGNGRPFKPWLDIPPEDYYRYNVFFCAPSMFLGWILAAGTVQAISRWISREGHFEQVLCLLGLSIGIASWATGLHDLISSFLGAIHVIDQQQYEHMLNTPTAWRTLLWVQMLVYLVWFVYLFSLSCRIVYRLPWWKSLLLGLAGFATYQGFFLIFNR